MNLVLKDIGELLVCNENFDILQEVSIVVKNGIIQSIGSIGKENGYVISCKNKVVMPGFVDPHTHLLYDGDRIGEMAERFTGKSYIELLKGGRGIWETVQRTRRKNNEYLKEKVRNRLSKMATYGTTTIEIKTGYGLSANEEARHLEILQDIKSESTQDIVLTYLGAHSIPPDRKREEYIDELIEKGIPSARYKAEFCDIFLEDGAFSHDEALKILTTAKENGLKLKLHADELTDSGGALLAAELGAVSCEHMTFSNEGGIKAMKNAGTVACILPGTSFFLKSKFGPVEKLRELNIPIAIGTDHNPGTSPFLSQLTMARLGVFLMDMTMEETLLGITLWAAKSILKDKELGSVEKGKQADLVILDVPHYPYIFYYPEVQPVLKTIKKGEIIYDATC